MSIRALRAALLCVLVVAVCVIGAAPAAAQNPQPLPQPGECLYEVYLLMPTCVANMPQLPGPRPGECIAEVYLLMPTCLAHMPPR
jgi:hypothetical protein